MKRWLAGALLITIGWLASPASVPIYDGIGTDDPYRFAGKTPAPSTATQTVKVGTTGSDGIAMQTAETGPQLNLQLPGGAFLSKASSLTVTATPSAGAGSLPRGTFDGNDYTVALDQPATYDPNAGTGFLYLRAATMTTPNPVIVHRKTPTDPWVEVKTTKSGMDIMVTTFREAGDYAVVRLPGSKALSQGGVGTTRLVFLGGGVLLLVVVTVLVLRRPRED